MTEAKRADQTLNVPTNFKSALDTGFTGGGLNQSAASCEQRIRAITAEPNRLASQSVTYFLKFSVTEKLFLNYAGDRSKPRGYQRYEIAKRVDNSYSLYRKIKTIKNYSVEVIPFGRMEHLSPFQG